MNQPAPGDPGLLLGLLPLVSTTIVVLLAVAALPSLLLQPNPRLHPEPATSIGDVMNVARSATGRWILNGAPRADGGLIRQLQALRFKPSAGLASAEVAASLAWLQQHSRLPVLVEWPGDQW
jgi:hypothetical protein